MIVSYLDLLLTSQICLGRALKKLIYLSANLIKLTYNKLK